MPVASQNTPIPIVVEILINGAWQDISRYVYQRDDIIIGGGQSDETQQPQPSSMTLTLNNKDNRFSPQNSSGVYFPYLLREVQIRLAINGRSSTGQALFGYRFWGSVPNWPPSADPTGLDAYVKVIATGPLRRVNVGGGVGSALLRYYQSLRGTQFFPKAYWPCEEDTATQTSIQSAVTAGTPMSVVGGPPLFKGSNAFNGSGPIGVVNRSTWDGLTGQFNSSGDDVYIGPGTFTWVSPVTSVDCRMTGSGGGGASADGAHSTGGHGGGGGEIAREAAAAVTVGKAYKFTLPKGGDGGNSTSPGGHNYGKDGAAASVALDAVTVTGHGGQGGAGSPGAGGTGSANTVHQNGGAGGSGAVFGGVNGGGGGGGGGSAGITGPGGAGGNAPAGNNNGGIGGTAGAGGGAIGGHGGRTADDGFITIGGTPGAGGGGGGLAIFGVGLEGLSGAPAKAEFIYTPATVPTNNVIRFICVVPTHGGNVGKILFRAFTGGTIHQLDVEFTGPTSIALIGRDSGGLVKFTSSNINIGANQPVMVSIEGGPSGSSTIWDLVTVVPGATKIQGLTTNTVATTSLGNVTECLVSPNADISKTAVGHITVQYALVPLIQVANALGGHVSEMTVDRFVRLIGEQAMDSIPAFNERADHWGFEKWVHVAQGTPVLPNYYIATQSAAATADIMDEFIAAINVMTGDDTGFEGGTVGSWIANPTAGNCALTNNAALGHTGTHSMQQSSSAAGTMSAVWNPALSSMLSVNPGDIVQASGWVEAAASVRSCQVGVQYFTAAGTFISTVLFTGVNDAVGSFTQVFGQDNNGAPATAAWARGISQVNSTAGAAEIHNWDDLHLANLTTVYRVTALSQPFAGFVNVFFAPDLPAGVAFNGAANNTNVATSSEPPKARWKGGTVPIGSAPGAGVQGTTQAWVATNGTLAATTNFNTDPHGSFCLTLTANGAGNPSASSPTGTAGQPVAVGDIVSIVGEIMTPTALSHMYMGIKWYQSSGAACAHAEDDTPDDATSAGVIDKFTLKATAPATAAFFAVTFGDHNVDANGTVMNIDNVRTAPRMGQQTRKELKEFLKELKSLEAGILKEYKYAWGLGWRTRISLMYQTPSVILDYTQHLVSPDGSNAPAPVQDDYLLHNSVTLKRHKGATINVQAATFSGVTGTGSGPPTWQKTQRHAAEADEQLAALAAHLLTLGTDPNERIPMLSLDMTRPAMANLWGLIGLVEVGDSIQINNVPTWWPNNPAQQMVIGYQEVISAFKWTITWNCRPYYPFTIGVQSVPRRW